MTSTSRDGAREMKIVAAVVVLLSTPVYAATVFLGHWDARAICLLVGTSILGIGAGLFGYAVRPAAFGGSGVVGDPLRTRYRTPQEARVLRGDALVHPDSTDSTVGLSNAKRYFGVSEHIYRWQSVRRVAPGERIWTPAYMRLVLAQLLGLVLAVVVNIALAIGVTFGFAAVDGAMWFVAAMAALAATFALASGAIVADGEEHPTTAMEPLPEAAWRPANLTRAA
jgi:hypothetical protein